MSSDRPVLSSDSPVLARLIARGLHIAEGLGFDFSRVRTNNDSILRDADALSLLRQSVFAAEPPNRWPVPYVYWAVDQSARVLRIPGGSASKLLVPLRRDGFVSISDWGLGARQLTALRTQVDDALAQAKGGAVRSRGDDAELPALRGILRNATLAHALRSYFGGRRVRYDGHTILQLTNELHDPAQYMSSEWHHDRCGRRLKLFIFMHDVGEDARPTHVLRGSHNLMYTSYELQASRGAHVEAWTARAARERPDDLVRLTGPAGGGFLLDTNALHRGAARGSRPRTVVLMHFHAHGKVERLGMPPARLKGDCAAPVVPLKCQHSTLSLSNSLSL